MPLVAMWPAASERENRSSVDYGSLWTPVGFLRRRAQNRLHAGPSVTSGRRPRAHRFPSHAMRLSFTESGMTASTLLSYAHDRWVEGGDGFAEIASAIDGRIIAQASR